MVVVPAVLPVVVTTVELLTAALLLLLPPPQAVRASRLAPVSAMAMDFMVVIFPC